MRYLYLFITTIIIGSSLIIGNQKANSANVFAGPSILNQSHSEVKLSSVEKIKKPMVVSENNPEISSPAYLVLDRETLTPLIAKNGDSKYLIASVTKLMTAVVSLEKGSLSDIIEVKEDLSSIPASKMGLYDSEKISLENILKGLLISSSNDAAEVLANYFSKGNYNDFIKMMNDKALSLGMKNTHFSNAVGLDNDQNYSTANDLALLANYALQNDFIAKTVQITEERVSSVDGKTIHYLKTTNELLGDKDVDVYGLKTGETPLAGGCLVTIAKTKNGEEIITVVLDSPDRFGDTKRLIQWVEGNIEWK